MFLKKDIIVKRKIKTFETGE